MTMWMVRAGNDGKMFEPFINHSVVAIEKNEIEDLTPFSSREEIYAEVRRNHPGFGPRRCGIIAGRLFHFSQEMEIDHYVITYDSMRRLYAVGRITGDYRPDPDFNLEYPHVRPVEWIIFKIPRDSLSATTKNTLGSLQAVFRLAEDAEKEILVVGQDGDRPQPADPVMSVDEDFLEDTQSRSVEFIKDVIVRLDWEDMQELVAGLLRAMGYRTRISPRGPDRGKDIVASRDGLGFENPRIVVEVKHRPGTSMAASDIRSFVGGRHTNDRGLYVSTGGFTREARYEAERANVQVTAMDLDELVEAIIEHYENMDIETRMLLPLKRVYWPIDDSRNVEPNP